MFPYHSPIRQNSGYNDVSNSPSISSRVPISLHGLFGETLGIDDQSVTSFSLQQSPPCGSYVSSKRTSSKSPIYSSGSGQFQTVLLSELADITPQNGLIDFAYQRSAICSYISPYDNRRCTYSAATVPDPGKSFCAKHSELSRAIVFSPEINNNSSIGYQPIKPHFNNNNKLKDEFELQNNLQFKPDLYPGPTLNTLNLNEGKSTNHNRINNLHIKSPIRIPNGNNEKINIKNKTTKPATKTKPFPQQNSQHSREIINEVVAAKGKKVLNKGIMDGDVLQAVVDLLNKNHDRLTSKQQIELLNSLGVMVTTINNPNDLVRGNPVNGINLGNSGSFNVPIRNENLPNLEKQSQLRNQNNATSTSKANPTNLQKRKIDSTDGGSGKKFKKGESSLSHLTSVELDVRVSEAIASIGGFNSYKSSSKPNETSMKKSVKSLNFLRKSLAPVSTVNMVMNPAITVDGLRIDQSKKEVMEFAHHLLDAQLNLKGLFPIGPTCNNFEKNVCTCKIVDYKFEVPKTKQKHSAKQLTRMSLSHKCTNKNCRSTGKFLPPDNLPVNLDIIPQRSETKLTKINDVCRLMKGSKKLYKSALKSEKLSLKLLVDAAKSDINATAALLKQVEPSEVSVSRRHITNVRTSQFCKLKDNSGKYFCPKKTLPLSCYCREHILHCDYQQLYKPGPDMKIRADIVPEFQTLRPRKKTKVLPLSKRKKRKVKKNKIFSKTANGASKSLDGEASATAEDRKVVLDGHDVLLSQPVNYTSPELEQYDEKTSVMKREDVSFTENLNMSDESLSIMVDEDSTSAALESFSLDGTLLNEVMPEVFQDLGFLGQGGDNLDSAYLLGNSKLNFEELSANPLFYSNPESSELLDDNFTGDANNLNEVLVDKNQSETTKAFNESMFLQKESGPQKTWNSDYCKSLEFPDNNDSSFDSSFADELNELEGVIQSLQEETDSQNLTKINENNFTRVRENEYSTANEISSPGESTLQTTLNSSIDSKNLAQNNIILCNSSATKPCTSSKSLLNGHCESNFVGNCNTNQSSLFSNKEALKSETDYHSSIKSLKMAKNCNSGLYSTEQIKQDNAMKSHTLSGHQVYVTNSIFKDSGFNKNNPISVKTPQKFSLSTFNHTPVSRLTAKSKATKKQTNHSKTLVNKRAAKSQKTNVKNVKLQMDQLMPTLHKQNMNMKLEEDCNLKTMRFPTVTTISPPLNNQKGDKILVPSSNAKSRQKANNPVGIPGYVAPMLQQGAAPTFRIQSGLVNGGIMCTGSNPVGNRGMVLIPVNAVMRSNPDNQNNVSNNTMGLTFAVPAQNGFNSQIGTVLRCSAMLSNDNQKIFVLNGIPSTNLVGTIPATNKQSQNLKSAVNTAGQTIVLPSTKKSTTNNKHQSIVIAPALSQMTQDSTGRSKKPKPIHNINRQSMVIPPAAIPTTTIAKKKKKSEKAIDNGGTVHWNPTSGGLNGPTPPVPRPKEHGTVGGQTANMLYCRRISPSLNNINPQHVILGRIGSLGRAGKSHLKLADKGNFISSPLRKGVKKEIIKTESVANTDNETGVCFNRIHVKDSSISTSVSSSSTVECTPLNLVQRRKIESLSPQIPPPSVKLLTSKHNCRKTGHTTIKDPDLIEAKN